MIGKRKLHLKALLQQENPLRIGTKAGEETEEK